MVVTVEARAYFAGFFDGEGCISIMGIEQDRGSLRVGAFQKVRGVLDEMVTLWGGSIHWNGQSQTWARHCVSLGAAKFLRDVRPYLRVKAPQADLGLAFQELKSKGAPGKLRDTKTLLLEEKIALRIKELKTVRDLKSEVA